MNIILKCKTNVGIWKLKKEQHLVLPDDLTVCLKWFIDMAGGC